MSPVPVCAPLWAPYVVVSPYLTRLLVQPEASVTVHETVAAVWVMALCETPVICGGVWSSGSGVGLGDGDAEGLGDAPGEAPGLGDGEADGSGLGDEPGEGTRLSVGDGEDPDVDPGLVPGPPDGSPPSKSTVIPSSPFPPKHPAKATVAMTNASVAASKRFVTCIGDAPAARG
jgi:hypothetical protein